MMKVTLTNKQEITALLYNWGAMSRICYDTPEGREVGVGKHCLNAGHFSGSRAFPLVFNIQGISRACSHQLVRHSVGTGINQRSQRYCNEENTEFVIPPAVQAHDDAKFRFELATKAATRNYKHLVQSLLEAGRTKEEAHEDARYLLPNATVTELNMSFTVEALINLAKKRLCKRSQWEIRELTKLLVKEASDAVPELAKHLVPQCVPYGRCLEGKTDCLFPKDK